MKKGNIINFIPFAIAAGIFCLLEWLTGAPVLYWWVFAAIILANIIAAYLICTKKTTKEWYNFAILPVTISVASLGYLVIIDKNWLIQSIVIMLPISIYLYWRFVYFYLHNQSCYTSFSLESLSYYINTFTIFFTGAAALGLKLFLSLRVWQILLAATTVLFLVIYQSFWVSKFNIKKNIKELMTTWLVLSELFFILITLPHDHNMLGVIWASAFYLVMMLVVDQLNGQLNKFKVKSYLIIVFTGWLLLFATAVWL